MNVTRKQLAAILGAVIAALTALAAYLNSPTSPTIDPSVPKTIEFCDPRDPDSPCFNPNIEKSVLKTAKRKLLPWCRIIVDGRTYGSGTQVDTTNGKTLILTCKHLFTRTENPKITVIWLDGTRRIGTLIKVSSHVDLAAISVDSTPAFDIRLGKYRPGETLFVNGFGSPAQSYQQFAGATDATIGTAIRQGDSGAGVMNSAGHLVGVAWGTTSDSSKATVGEPVTEFLWMLTECPSCHPSERLQRRIQDVDPKYRPVDPPQQPEPEPLNLLLEPEDETPLSQPDPETTEHASIDWPVVVLVLIATAALANAAFFNPHQKRF